MLPGWWPQVRLIHLCTSPLVFEGGRGCGTSALQWDTEEENGGQLWGYLGWSAEAQPAQPSRGTSDPPVWPHEAQSDFSVRRVGGGGGGAVWCTEAAASAVLTYRAHCPLPERGCRASCWHLAQRPPSRGHLGALSSFLCTLLFPLPPLPCCASIEIRPSLWLSWAQG